MGVALKLGNTPNDPDNQNPMDFGVGQYVPIWDTQHTLYDKIAQVFSSP